MRIKQILFCCLGAFFIQNALAQDSEEFQGSGISLPDNLSLSVYGTAAYAIGNTAYEYNRISERGTFDSGSNIGVQADWAITPRLGLTLQAEMAPSTSDDHRWRPQLTWALLKYRVTDNWALKIGRSRLPALLYTQNSNVGISYVPARLPIEVYDLSPTFEYNGIASTYTWDVGENGMQTISWDVYGGFSDFDQRIWFRDAYPPRLKQGANYYKRRMVAGGTFLTYEDLAENNVLRVGLHYAHVKDRNGTQFLKRHNVVNLNGFDIYSPVGTETSKNIKFLLFTLMGDWNIGNDFYLTGEFGVRRAMNINSGLDSRALYLQLRRRFGDFTPYFSWTYSQSRSRARATYKAMLAQSGVATYDMLNRISADAMVMADQSTLAIGTAYDIGTNHRLKLEYARTRLGRGSYLADPSVLDGDLDGKGINIFTASYNFLF